MERCQNKPAESRFVTERFSIGSKAGPIPIWGGGGLRPEAGVWDIADGTGGG